MSDSPTLDVMDAVRTRYSQGATERVPELCCPVDYDASLLEVLPDEIIERDYGCGDPSRFCRPGDRVLDLGSGAGKICYMASQLVGAEGHVIGVDTTPDMLALAREHSETIGKQIGWTNTEFRNGTIQDLALDRDKLGAWVAKHPVDGLEGLEALEAEAQRLRKEEAMIPDGSIDLVLSNCVLNLIENDDKERLFREIHRVLKRGGRCAISDIVSDEDVPEELQKNPELWSGCISGAMREDRFLQAFADAGLYGVEIAAYQEKAWAIVDGIEFRSMTVVAHKGKEGPCWEHNEALIYKGPWKQVIDDDGHVFRRGERSAVCHKTFGLMQSEPYASSMLPVPPLSPIPGQDAGVFSCNGTRRRDPEETKTGVIRENVAPGCDDDACC